MRSAEFATVCLLIWSLDAGAGGLEAAVPAEPERPLEPVDVESSDGGSMTSDDDDDGDASATLDQILVTGSRIRRINIEGPLPLSVVERQQLLDRGEANVADAVRDLPWNSFGSFGDLPNSDIPNASLPNLRGLGSKYTLSLLDGYRLPGFAGVEGGAAASLSGIPMAAIDRIEVLRDGASAIYGSDAIGGVINLLSRREDAPLTLEFQIEEPEQSGGETRRASVVWGSSRGDSHWLLAAEVLDREPLLGADRDYLIALAGLSLAGNPGSFRRLNPTTGNFVGVFEVDPRCPAALDSDPVFPSSGPVSRGPNTLCGFRFRDQNAERAGYEGASLFANLRHEFTPELSFFGRILAIDGDSTTQLAPSPVAGLRIAADNPFNPTRGERGEALGWPLLLQYRLSALGPRVTEVASQTLHLLAGLNGLLDWADGGEWNASMLHNRYEQDARGVSGYALRSEFDQAVRRAEFDPFTALPGDSRGLEGAIYQPTSSNQSRSSALELAFNLDSTLFDLSASYAFGLDLRRDEYRISTDPQARIGNVLGGGVFGEPEQAARNYGGVYGEAYLPFGEGWELSLASRYDYYEDTGGALSPKLALAFRPNDKWLLRGSLGKGFQAPDLVAAYGGQESAEFFLTDALACATRPEDPFACDARPAEVNLVPNDQLGPERARQGTLGLIWQAVEQVQFGLDYYRSHIKDQIGRLRAEDVLALELDCFQTGRQCDPIGDGRVVRDDLGNLASIIIPNINIASVRSSGLDFEFSFNQPTTLGQFRIDLLASRVLTYQVESSPFLPSEDFLATASAPPWRGNLRLGWQVGAHQFSAGAEYIASRNDCFQQRLPDGSANPDCSNRIGSHTEFDAQWRWSKPWGPEIAVGGRNLNNRAPPHDGFGGYQYGLYDPNGRVWYLRVQAQFGDRVGEP
jgi:iron complex outermembrane receptor protein